MSASYLQVKAAVIGIIDFHSSRDVQLDYGTSIDANTKLSELGISPHTLSVMPPDFNEKMRALVGPAWRYIGATDLLSRNKIKDLILLACGQSGTALPRGEPT